MSKMIPLHRVAEELGYESEVELSVILRLVPGLPFETRRGVIYADPDLLADGLADRGVIIPAELVATNPDDDDGENDTVDEEEEDDAPRRRRR